MGNRMKELKLIERLRAELAQEKNLTKHLDGQVENLVEKNDNQRVIVRDQRAEIAGLENELAKVLKEIVNHEQTLAIIGNVLVEAGMDRSWGSDEQLTGLEDIAGRLNDESNGLLEQLDHIRTER